MNGYTNTAQDIWERKPQAKVKAPFQWEGPTGGAIGFRYADVRTGIGDVEEEVHGDEYSASLLGARLHGTEASRSNKIDSGLLKKAMELLESINLEDQFETQLQLVSLAGSTMEMWETAAESSEAHQEVLAILENGVRQVARDGMLSDEQLSAIREALRELSQTVLVRSIVETIRGRFVSAGFGPMAFAEDVREAP